MPETPDRTLSRLIESRVERMPDALALREGRAVAEALDGQLSIARVLRMQAESRPEAPAILAPGRIPLAYGPLWRQVEAVVAMLNALGVGRGDRVGVVLPQGAEMAVVVLAVASGATAAPLSPLHRKPEYERHLGEREIGTLIVQAGVESAARTVARARGLHVIELQPLSGAEAGRFALSAGSTASAAGPTPAEPDEVAFVLATSGTTTHSKIVPLTHVNVLAGAARTVRALELTPGDRVGIHDDFLELGGDSLVAMQLLARLREALRIDLSLQSVLDAPTVAGLAEMVQACQRDATAE